MGAGDPVGDGRDTDWRHDVIPALGTISGTALHSKVLHTPDDLSSSKRSIVLHESSALTSPGCDIPVQNWHLKAEFWRAKAGLCWAMTSWDDFAKMMAQQSTTLVKFPHQNILLKTSRTWSPLVLEIHLTYICICPSPVFAFVRDFCCCSLVECNLVFHCIVGKSWVELAGYFIIS